MYQEDEIGKAKYKTEYTYDKNGNCINVECDLSTLSKLFINCYISYNNAKDIYKLPLDSYTQITIEYVQTL
ncbi:MAG: hypothetical protein JXR69_05865 [Candidatus Delongbacteria bacterium]|nr:hypothetical protein [Candidatus Delongbacteria bacterium]